MSDTGIDERPLRSDAAPPPRGLVLAAYAIIYLVWGSTFLAILFAIETMPPLLMAGTRFLVAGGALYVWAAFSGKAGRPTLAQWRSAAVVGVLLLVLGNGMVVLSEFLVPTGVAALVVGSEPCFMVLFDWLRPGGARPGTQVVLGLGLGVVGLALLIGPDALLGGGRASPLGVSMLLFASVAWAGGSIYSRYAELPRSPFLATAMQMLSAGAVLTLVAAAHGEVGAVIENGASLRSVLALLYLIVFGSIVAFTAYIWLLRVSSPARVSTFAYVNPVVAMLLGWAFAGEALTARMILAAAVIVGGVALITLAPKPEPRPAASIAAEPGTARDAGV